MQAALTPSHLCCQGPQLLQQEEMLTQQTLAASPSPYLSSVMTQLVSGNWTYLKYCLHQFVLTTAFFFFIEKQMGGKQHYVLHYGFTSNYTGA